MGQWDKYYSLAFNYFEVNGSIISESNIIVDKIDITAWLKEQRECYRQEKLDKRQIKLLEEININWWYKCNWNDIYSILERYYKRYKNIDINSEYIIDSNYLNGWLARQRYDYSKGRLTNNKIKLLNSIGMKWKIYNSFDENYEIAKCYYEKNGCLDVPENELIEGVPLRAWLDSQRILYKKGNLSKEKKDKLEHIGIAWDLNEYKWDIMYKELKKYYNEHGNINIKSRGKINGYPLSTWLTYQRRLYKLGKLTEVQIFKLNKLGMDWIGNLSWKETYEFAKRYYEANGNLLVPRNEVISGLKLGKWINTQRCAYKKNLLSMDKIRLLENIGMIWDVKLDKTNSSWDYFYNKIYNYYKKYNNLDIPSSYVVYGISLNSWLLKQIERFNNKQLSEEQYNKLVKLGISRGDNNSVVVNWDIYYSYAKEYYYKYHNLLVPYEYIVSGVNLGVWIENMRTKYKNHTLETEFIGKLSLINMIWNFDKESKKVNAINELKTMKDNYESQVLYLVNNFGYDALLSFLSIIDYKINEQKINEIIGIVKDMFASDFYNLFILFMLGIEPNTISRIYDISTIQVDLIRLKIYKVILFELKSDFNEKDKEFVKKIMMS